MNADKGLSRNSERNAASEAVTPALQWRDVGEGTIGHDEATGLLVVIERCSRTYASLGLTWRWELSDKGLRIVARGHARSVRLAREAAATASQE
jgi:hypothetical protein